MGFDLAAIEMRKFAEEGVYFPILHAVTREPVVDDKGEQLKIRISGSDASRIKTAVEQREAARRAAEAVEKPGAAIVSTGWQQREQDLIDDLVLLTEGWTENFELDGQPFPFTKENAAVLYTRFPEIAEQMTQRATSRLNFMPTSAKK